MMPTPRKKKQVDNFKFSMGMGMNWVDIDKGVLYHIQDYKEAIDKGEKPKGIRISSLTETEIGPDGNIVPKDLGYATEEQVEAKMKDPEPDPKYAKESPREHRRNW